MSDRTHLVEIESIVLSGVDAQHLSGVTALIEAEIGRALAGTELSALPGVTSGEVRVAREAAHAVADAVPGVAR
jgi:hypothetical protein